MNETWKPIPGFDGYEVSSHGRVRTYWTTGRFAKIDLARPPKIKASHRDAYGYQATGLSRNRIMETCKVHRLVLLAFVGECPTGMEACHNDGDRSHNALYNLRWGTAQSNADDRSKHGTVLRGDQIHQSKLTASQVEEIHSLAQAGNFTQSQIAERFGIKSSTVCQIINGKRWKHLRKEAA